MHVVIVKEREILFLAQIVLFYLRSKNILFYYENGVVITPNSAVFGSCTTWMNKIIIFV